MINILLAIHILIAIFVIVLVLVQHGKGADMGAAFGSGSSQTVFGSKGAAPFLMKLTGVFAALFFATSLGMGYLSKQHVVDQNTLSQPVVPIEQKLNIQPEHSASEEQSSKDPVTTVPTIPKN